jgi:hypothetical protein
VAANKSQRVRRSIAPKEARGRAEPDRDPGGIIAKSFAAYRAHLQANPGVVPRWPTRPKLGPALCAEPPRKVAATTNPVGVAETGAIPVSPSTLSGEDCKALLGVLEATVPSIFPSAERREFMVGRAIETMRNVVGPGVGQLRRHRPLSRRRASETVRPLPSEIGVELFVNKLASRCPQIVAGKDLDGARLEIKNRWADAQRERPGQQGEKLCLRLLSIGLEVFGLKEPDKGVLRKLRPEKRRAERNAASDSFRRWGLDRLVTLGGCLYLSAARADYDRWRTKAPDASAVSTNKLSRLLAALPRVKRDEEGRAKVIVFRGISLKPVK